MIASSDGTATVKVKNASFEVSRGILFFSISAQHKFRSRSALWGNKNGTTSCASGQTSVNPVATISFLLRVDHRVYNSS